MRMPEGRRSSSTVAPALMLSMRVAVRKGMAISQTTSPSTSRGVAWVTFLYSPSPLIRFFMIAP